MNQNELQNKYIELLSDENFVNSLCEVNTPEEVASIFNNAGVDMSVNDAAQIMAYVTNDKEELDEEDLDAVGGGIIYVYCFVVGVGLGLLHGAIKNLKKSWNR